MGVSQSKDLLKNRLAVVEVLLGPPGSGNLRKLDARHGMGGYTVPDGDLSDIVEIDNVTGAFNKLRPGRDAPARIELSVLTRLRRVLYLEKNWPGKGLCEATFRKRHFCGTAGDPLDYERIEEFVQVFRAGREYDDAQVSIEDEQMTNVTFNLSAAYWEWIAPVNAARTALNLDAGVDDVDVNDVIYASTAGCAECGCGEDSDGCDLAFAVTDADSAPYATPYLFIYDDGVWSARVITGAAGDATSVVYAGSKVIVALPDDGGIAYATKDGDYNDWALVVADFLAGVPRRLFAVDASTIWAGCTGGAIYKSVDGGLSWTLALDAGELAIGDLNAVWFANANLGYFGGVGGELIKYEDGNFSEIPDPTGGDDILDIKVPPDRDCEVFLGTDGGEIWKSLNQGADWTEYNWPGNNAGRVDRIAFAGRHGAVMFFVQNNASDEGRVMRDLSGGAGGPDVEQVSAYALSGNNGYNAIDACDPNTAIFVGDVTGGTSFVGMVT